VFIQCVPALQGAPGDIPAPVPKPPSLPALSGLTAIAAPPGSNNGRNGAPLQSPDALTPPLPLTQGPPSPVIFLDSNMRVGPPVGPPQTPSQPGVPPPNKRNKQSPQQAMPPPPPPPPPQTLPQSQQGIPGQVLRHQADGLGLLIEAFDTHHQAGGTVVSPGVSNPYDPSGTQQDFFTPATLPTNDGYEHQLEYYITAGGHVPAAMGAWLGAPGLPGNMAGGIQPPMPGMFGY